MEVCNLHDHEVTVAQQRESIVIINLTVTAIPNAIAVLIVIVIPWPCLCRVGHPFAYTIIRAL
jgi:hypothetical protein